LPLYTIGYNRYPPEIDPMFGGQPDLAAYADTDGQLSDGPDGFARMVVPGDTAGGRYVSNLVALEVFTATAPEPATWVLLIASLSALMFLRSRRRAFARGNRRTNEVWRARHSGE
jgi:hypothetical protein